MPALSQIVIDDITVRLRKYIENLEGYGEPIFLDAGGSAAVFRVDSMDGPRAVKAFDPSLMSRAEKRRLEVQRRLIGHSCPSLIQTYRVDEAEGTAFMEMEFIEWPQLTKQLEFVPDEAVASLITQLVDAVRFLETLDIIHRDIKPENIHVSPDYKHLKLLDLGVARELAEGEAEAVTDHGNVRPFLATAQYSSPEYLFRLDEPSTRLWNGLNFYQVGAVLHDLIMKKPIFQEEMALGNRWLVARAVLTKTTSFADENPKRLASLKALAARCLVKDLETRLNLVGWDDFVSAGGKDALTTLRVRLVKGCINAGEHARMAAESRLVFDRNEFVKRLSNQVRSELINICGKQLPLTVKPSEPNTPPQILFELSAPNQISINSLVNVIWLTQIYERTANISISAWLYSLTSDEAPSPYRTKKIIYTATIHDGEDNAAYAVTNAIAEIANIGLDLIDGTPDIATLKNFDLLIQKNSSEEVSEY